MTKKAILIFGNEMKITQRRADEEKCGTKKERQGMKWDVVKVCETRKVECVKMWKDE